jgi:ubiquitin-protein ligase
LDFERLQARFARWPLIQISSTSGLPPEHYQFTYLVKGLYVAPGGNILEREQHLVEVNLSLGYPRRAPQCKVLTPVFHPNFDDSTVCIGDFWAASEGLEDLVIRIGRMLTYQEFNVKSPLNGLAARWAAENAHLLPVDPREIAPPLRRSEGVEEGPGITLSDEVSDGAGGAAGNGGQLRRKGPPPLPGAASAKEEDESWGSRIVIDFNESGRSSGKGASPSSAAVPAGSVSLIRLSPGLKFEELKVTCRACEQSMLLDAALLGQTFQCPNCGRTHRVAETA